MRWVFLVGMLFAFTSYAADSPVREYRFPEGDYSVKFPCKGGLDESKISGDGYDVLIVNMKCNDKLQTYSAFFYAFKNLDGLNNSSQKDKITFLREFRDMVGESYVTNYKKYEISDEKPVTVNNFVSLKYKLVSKDETQPDISIVSQASLDKNNALYLTSSSIKDKENVFNLDEFFGSVKTGKK